MPSRVGGGFGHRFGLANRLRCACNSWSGIPFARHTISSNLGPHSTVSTVELSRLDYHTFHQGLSGSHLRSPALCSWCSFRVPCLARLCSSGSQLIAFSLSIGTDDQTGPFFAVRGLGHGACGSWREARMTFLLVGSTVSGWWRKGDAVGLERRDLD